MHCSVQHYKTTSYQFDALAAKIWETWPTASVGQVAGWASKLVWMLRKVFFLSLPGIEMWSLCRPFRNTVTVPNVLFGPLKMLLQYLKNFRRKHIM